MSFWVVGAVFLKLECCRRNVFELVIEFFVGRAVFLKLECCWRNVLELVIEFLEKVGAI